MLYDKDIREPLFDFLEETYGKARFLEEKQMGKSRADVVMILPDQICGIEIKSDADTYIRLQRQVPDYDQYFDRNYIVAGTSHAMHVQEHVPEWWGIITVEMEEDGVDFYILRKPRENPNMDWEKKMTLLWRPELVHIQEINQMPKYKEKSKKFVIEKILLCVPRDKLREQVSEELFERDYNTIHDQINAYRTAGNKPKRRRKRRRRRAL